MSDMKEAVAELRAEQAELDALLAALPDEQWALPTPAEGWDVRDQVSHLADTNEVAYDTATGGKRQLNEEALSFPFPEDFTESGCEKGRAMTTTEVLTWWRTTTSRVNEMFLGKDPRERVPWGLGMSARMLVTARLMEHWAHGLDIRAAVGEQPNASPRLRSIAFLIVKAAPYAFTVAKIDPPQGTLRVDLTYDGETWTIGGDDADARISGDALEFCRVGVQRLPAEDATTLRAEGALAETFLRHARAFL